MKTASAKSEDVTINGIEGFGYYDKERDQYQIVLPYGDFQTIANINIRPKVRFSSVTGEEIYNREEIKQLISTIKIKRD